MTQFYAGIGSRRTPEDVLVLMEMAARRLARLGYILRSGAAGGADAAFEQGAGSAVEIFLPWPRFNGHSSPLNRPSPQALEMASRFHPAWDRVSRGGRLLHARNCYQVLGHTLEDPVQFVLCWHDGSGGTLQAVRIAESRGIPVFNLRDPETRAHIEEFVRN